MFEYSLLQIIIFFFIYCFAGWIWESCYVSVRKRRWVNRGFLHGPIIPIYGFGALTILFATLPVKDNLWLVFICGMLGASVLELVTGTVMEALFHVRLWDYTNVPTNIKGYISLPTSMVWGVFSIIMVKFVHEPVSDFVLRIPPRVTELLAVVLTIFGSIDTTLSVREALDLKAILKKISENESVARVQKRMDVLAAVIDNDVEAAKERINQKLEMLDLSEFKRVKSLLDRNPTASSKRYQEYFATVKASFKEIKKSKKK